MRAPGFPTRGEFIAWGMRHCREHDCRVLVNPELLPDLRCTLCARRLKTARKARSAHTNRRQGAGRK